MCHALARRDQARPRHQRTGFLQDFIPTFAAANGEPDSAEKVKKGFAMGGKTYKVHLDGFNLRPFLAGKEEKSPRQGFETHWSYDGNCMAMRMGRFKIVFSEQRSTGLAVWREPLSAMRLPKSSSTDGADPFERGEEKFQLRHLVPLRIFPSSTRRHPFS